jgi:hypothetical protein
MLRYPQVIFAPSFPVVARYVAFPGMLLFLDVEWMVLRSLGDQPS